ncbi:alpha/beta fold hydrolase [Burkholderia oklahomensis]|uniref:Alpha/beta hydrolase fold family protein n=1 Tax=Burkholderia oklahomensis TaxID=342113 RepID=A0AAI8FQV1_9BURK|nr:alpha/beta fold hydrolase [Burkholderia oklahomensis]AIO69267.1 alpha/beta hydrolase fold family protein [Burkholderia oklahomensis]AOI39482.1 alpha/beta hydrolase [Burkholderia oklahomensis EO147]KUY50395.1 alpha/beta hydrolase [Burkholderia oklahomensis EO147]QPS40168.1 alpha/beta fold hydrolase [Burkholderia oklahomensis]
MSAISVTTNDIGATPFAELLERFPERRAAAGAAGAIGYREAGDARGERCPVVLLHGIGSGAASWVRQLDTLGATRRALAWDAPGYGASSRVAAESPVAADYAASLDAWLDALRIERCVLVGHSLGAIVAGAFARAAGERLSGLLLISPAGGYGSAPADVRAERRDSRLALLASLGPQGLAEQRSANMLSAHASDAARAWVRWNMARIVPAGYAQATHLLANADLATDLVHYRGRVAVAVGADDAITPPAACERIAQAARVGLQVIPRAGHAGYVEAPDAYGALIDAFCRQCDGLRGAA